MNYSKQQLSDAFALAVKRGLMEEANELSAMLDTMEAQEAQQAQREQQAAGVPQGEQSLLERAGEMGKSIAVTGGSQAVGAGIGALPIFSIPTGGLSILAGSTIGSVVGEIADAKRRGVSPTLGGLTSAAIGGLIPGGSVFKGAANAGRALVTRTATGTAAKATGREIGKEAAIGGGVNLAAANAQTLIDEGRFTTGTEAAIAGGLGAGLPAAGHFIANRVRGVGYSDVRSADEISKQSDDVARMITFQEGRAAGLLLDPSLENANVLNNTAVYLADQSTLQKRFSEANQKTVNQMMRDVVGVRHFDVDEMDASKKILFKPYEEFAEGSKDRQQLIDTWKTHAADARREWQAHRTASGGDQKHLENAIAADKRRDIADAAIELEAAKTGNQSLYKEIKAARVELAKWHAVDSSLNYANGDISSAVLGAMYSADNKRLTGNLKVVAKMANSMPHVMKNKVDIANTTSGAPKWRVMLLAGGAAGTYTGSPIVGMATAAAVGLGSNPLRKFIKSGYWQDNLSTPRASTPRYGPDNIEKFLRYAGSSAGRNVVDQQETPQNTPPQNPFLRR